jgi:uncharacterized protein YggE
MYQRKSVVISVSAAVALLGLVVMLAQAGFAPLPVRAQGAAPQGTITVVGQGSVKIKPDIAQVAIGVEVVQPTVKEASQEASVVMNRVLGVLKQQGIEDKDIQTSTYSVWMERPYKPDGSQGTPVFHVSNQVNVTVRQLDKLGDVLDATIAAGANNIYGVTFSLADKTQVENEARQKAVADARAKAEDLATLTDLRLGEVISVSEVIGGATGGYYPGGVEKAAAIGMGGGGPVAPGELEVTLQLQVVYGTVQ